MTLQKVDSDDSANTDLLEEYDVRSIPTLVVVSDSGKVLGKLIGAQSEIKLREWISSLTDISS